ncbi:MAG: hypothetical protein ACETWQ_08350 [Phycisphaerae bacterium]
MNKKNIIGLTISIVLPVSADPITGEKKCRKEKGPCFAGEGCRTKQRLK